MPGWKAPSWNVKFSCAGDSLKATLIVPPQLLAPAPSPFRLMNPLQLFAIAEAVLPMMLMSLLSDAFVVSMKMSWHCVP